MHSRNRLFKMMSFILFGICMLLMASDTRAAQDKVKILVKIRPSGARNEGARWNLMRHGDTCDPIDYAATWKVHNTEYLHDQDTGTSCTWEIKFKDIDGWITPPNIVVTLTPSNTVNKYIVRYTPAPTNTYYRDNDGDGYGDPGNTTDAASAPAGYVENDDDCDDTDPNLFPGQSWYKDHDNDGYSDGSTQLSCQRPAGYKTGGELAGPGNDCDDEDGSRHPGADDPCEDGVDQDCNGEDPVCTTDLDGDGWAEENGDCNDYDSGIYPGASEICGDGIDQDCFDGDLACDETVCVTISDIPLDTQFQAAPANIMFVLDDSGSMDFEFMTPESGGKFNNDYYLFHMGDHKYSDSNVVSSSDRDLWRSQWAGYNKMYYNPNVTYAPWPDTAGYPDMSSGADPNNPRSHPTLNSSITLDMDGEFSDASESGISVKNAHYYAQSGGNTYLVMITGGSIRYYRLNNAIQNSVKDSGVTEVAAAAIDPAITTRDYTAERKNFANWFSFYRKRTFTATSALATVIKSMNGVNIGIYSINGSIKQAVLPVRVNDVDHSDTLLDLLYELDVPAKGTPLRKGLKTAGQYFHAGDGVDPTGLGASPYATTANGGACQQSFAIAMTDGYWSGSSPSMTDQDGDGHADTLADVAMYYYKNDLSTLADKVPTNEFDANAKQHMLTYGVAFGVNGKLDPAAYPNCPWGCAGINPNCEVICPDWADPATNPDSDSKKIDDLWHATANARGRIWSAGSPVELATALKSLMLDIEQRLGSGASVAINSQELTTDTVMYQGSYHTDNWSGDVRTFPLDPETGKVSETSTWSAAEKLAEDLASDENWWSFGRKVVTYSGSTGIPFTAADSGTIGLGTTLINYIRGDDSNEGTDPGDYRIRSSALGDVVHASPLYVNGHLFAGANDGMLHALDAHTGKEVFAYVPRLVSTNLHYLSDPVFSHKYFVDLPPFAFTEKIGGTSTTLLVGGLGKGGKGYYCLDISSLPPSSESAAANMVKWEFPPAVDDDMGYSYSKAFIVDSNAGKLVIFGNGYGSANGSAVLYVLDASGGNLIKKIDTEFGSASLCNGLSTPALTDVDYDGKVDFAYAGDLRGNLWKFDLRSADKNSWGVAYKKGTVPQPLFQARNASGAHQPITVKPDVIRHCVDGTKGYIVVFGTGRYLGADDFSDTGVQSIYGIWDWGDEWHASGSDDRKTPLDKYLGRFEMPVSGKRRLSNITSLQYLSSTAREVTLLQQTEIYSDENVSILSDTPIDWYTPSKDTGTHAGWYFDLTDTGSKVIRDFVIRDGVLILIASIPSNTPCESGGDSIIYEINACNGGRLDEPQFDYNKDGELDEKDLIEIDDPDNPGKKKKVPPSGWKRDEMYHVPVILPMPDQETDKKYFSTSLGNVKTIDERAEGVGMFYWRESD